MTNDRRVHAERGDEQLVRYDKAGKYYIEFVPARLRPCRQVTLKSAAINAVRMEREGGVIHLGLPGGSAFDRAVKKERASVPTEKYRVEQDSPVRMSYVYVRPDVKVHRTIHMGLVNVDVGEDGDAVGVEICGLLHEPEEAEAAKEKPK
jgi:uncharacterized protein YuzE